ncbi:MAG: aspartate carbamoyltransferase [Waddliaceae bacterium]
MASSFAKKHVIAISDFTKDDLLHLLDKATELKERQQPHLLQGRILGSCFFEPSTRTRLSFEAAMHRLGGSVIGFSNVEDTSVKKGESFHDTMKIVSRLADVIVLRHPLEGAPQLAADAIEIPVINAGDGANEHPTQAFLDLFTIRECQGTLDHLHIAMVGDLKYGRTAHSLAHGLIPFQSRLYFISHPSLEMPKSICDKLREKGVKFSFHSSLEEIIHKLDIVYMTRTQGERLCHCLPSDLPKEPLILKPSHFCNVKNTLKILHPLPRTVEIDVAIDKTPYAHYFQQAENGLYIRQALLGLVLGVLS